MRSRIGRRPANPRTTPLLAAAWAVIAAFLAALAAQALAQAAHEHPAANPIATQAACSDAGDHHNPSSDPHQRHGGNPCPVCEKTSLARLSLAPRARRGAILPAPPTTIPAWHPAAEADSLPIHAARARGPPGAA